MLDVAENSLSLLVSDDSTYVRQHLVSMLSKLPKVEVIGEAENIAETIEAVQELEPDAIILDIHMPDGSGIDVLKYVKQHVPETIVIMLTNHANAIYKRACLKAGANYFFDKSTEFERAAEVLAEISTGTA